MTVLVALLSEAGGVAEDMVEESVDIVVESVEVVVSELLLQEHSTPAHKMAKKAKEFFFIMLIFCATAYKNFMPE